MKNKKGFSIGEVLIAMFILLVGMVDAVFLTVRSVADLTNSRDAVIATLLAQEGTELVRNVRDNNVTQADCGTGGNERCTAFDQNYGFPSETGSTITTCRIDYAMSTDGGSNPLDCGIDESESKLFLNRQTGLYGHDSGGNTYIESKLRRMIIIEYDETINGAIKPDNRLANVTGVVVYGDADFPDDIESDCKINNKCVYAQTRLTSWINYGD
jgi:hypothetical protein